jgi:hypothetical protein
MKTPEEYLKEAIVGGSVSKAQLIFAVEQAQREAYNEAIRAAADECIIVEDKNSILKLLKK